MIWDYENGLYMPRRKLAKPARSFMPGMFPAGAVSPVAGGLQMNGSIIFNGSNEDLRIASFSSSSPNRKTFTISFWARFDAPNFDNVFEARTDANNSFTITRDNDFAGLFAVDQSGGSLQYFGDFGADVATATWEHWVLAVDTTQGTADNRVRVYLNGVEQSDTASPEFTQNDDAHIFVNGSTVLIGGSTSFEDFDGRLADFIVVEGQQLTASDFGYDNGGTWSWKDYTGTFGTHGFRINPQDNSEIGTDQSGNGYNFTLTNMDTSNFDGTTLPPV